MVAAEIVIAVHLFWGEISKDGCWVKRPELFQSADVTRECGQLWEQGEGFSWSPGMIGSGLERTLNII